MVNRFKERINMRKILIIGAGGIGSFLIQFLNKVELYDITVADPDVVETKNIPYQNFNQGDVGFNKAVRMKCHYGSSVNKISEYPILTEKQMKGYEGIREDLIETASFQ